MPSTRDRKAEYARRRAKGLCVRCTNQARPARRTCAECAEKEKIAWQKKFESNKEEILTHWRKVKTIKNRIYRLKKRAQGLCFRCLNKAILGRSFCQKHWDAHQKDREKRLAQRKALYAKRRKAGLCGLCTRQAAEDSVWCSFHRKYRLQYLQNRRIKLKIKKKKVQAVWTDKEQQN